MQATRFRVTHVETCRNGDNRIYLLLDGADGSGEVRNVRFMHCDRQSLNRLEGLDLGATALEKWRGEHGGTLDASQVLLAHLGSAVPAS